MTAVQQSVLLVLIAAILLAAPLTQASVDDSDAQPSAAILVLQSAVIRDGTVRVLRHGTQSDFAAPGLRYVPLSCPASWDSQAIFACTNPNPIPHAPLRC